VLEMVEASHKRAGGTVGLGISAGQRLGLEHLPYRDAALAAMHHEAAAAARRIAAMEGAVHDTKRVKLNDFHRGAGVLLHNSAHKTSFDLGLTERLSRPALQPSHRVRDASGCSDGRLDAGGTRLRHVL
jgi:hypothetical protein